ncbi:MAG TPA: hypothetical protein VEY88_19990 [Archangium sp.]|jgi:hypothetical protein|nr:hypothetical protein [Archangium sp.]
MRLSALAHGMNVQAPSRAPGAQGVGATSFQARLSTGTGGPSFAGEAGFSGSDIVQQAAQDMRAMLRLQVEMSKGETSLISNILKTRHDTAKNSIQNIR